MGTLVINYELSGFDRILYNSPAQWENCTFKMNEKLIASVRIWEEGIESYDELRDSAAKIEWRLKSLILALEWKYGRELKYRIREIIEPPLENENIAVRDITCIEDEVNVDISPQTPPLNMPQAPLQCERWIKTLIEANRLSDFVEEQLKRQYLIIEELWDDFASEYNAEEHKNVKSVKIIRHFVSHESCNDRTIVNFIEPLLPSAIINNGIKKKVRFLRNIEHRNFVAQFEIIAREIARSLIQKKIAQFSALV
jgi:hypothetical protein